MITVRFIDPVKNKADPLHIPKLQGVYEFEHNNLKYGEVFNVENKSKKTKDMLRRLGENLLFRLSHVKSVNNFGHMELLL